MIFTNKKPKINAWYVKAFKIILSSFKPKLKPTKVKFPLKYFLITVLSTVLIWTIIASAIIYRSAYKKEVAELAKILRLKGRREKHSIGKAVKAIISAPFNWANSKLLIEEIPHLYIDIKFKYYQKLLQKRQEALEKGQLVTGPDSYIPAKIKYQNDTYKVKLRLKGDLLDHLVGDKWSLRIHLKGANHLFGMRRFSLQSPETRNFEGETIFYEALRREGVLTPRYFFVDLTINGKYKGIMAFEEHFSKELLESQGRKESVILKFDESLHVGNLANLGFDSYFNNYKNSLIKPFRYKRIKNSKDLTRDLVTAMGLLRGFAQGTLSSAQVFDAELMGRFIAVSSFWGSWHALRWHNIRLYYNPITARLEPIGYDAYLNTFKRKSIDPRNNPFSASLLESDMAIKPFYETTLRKLRNEAESGITEKWVRKIETQNLKILHKEYPFLARINLFGIEKTEVHNLKRNKSSVQKNKRILTPYLIRDKIGDYLELVNHLPQKVFVTKIERVNEKTGKRYSLISKDGIKYPFHIFPSPVGTAPRTKRIYFHNQEGYENTKIFVSASIVGVNKIWTAEAIPYYPALLKNPVPLTTINNALEKNNFLTYHSNSNSLRIKPGHWNVKESLVIPNDIRLVIPRGTILSFHPKAGIITSGPIEINGTSEEPVVLKGDFSHNENKSWMGISIIKSNELSVWSNVKIENTTGVKIDGWVLTGGVNFYQSDINMNNALFFGNRAEDALNVVRSKFKLRSVIFKKTQSDAFDSDFSNGTVEESMFVDIGLKGEGDGIDLSGSDVIVSGVYFKNISDKALSIGEKSQMKASRLNIQNVSIGAASKDGSHLFISDSKLIDIKKAGLMAYIKKPVYGPAEIRAKALEFSSTNKHAFAQKGSSIFINGLKIRSENLLNF